MFLHTCQKLSNVDQKFGGFDKAEQKLRKKEKLMPKGAHWVRLVVKF